jgi:hypothetical protein
VRCWGGGGVGTVGELNGSEALMEGFCLAMALRRFCISTTWRRNSAKGPRGLGSEIYTWLLSAAPFGSALWWHLA